ncbi:hypothetical protein OU798_20990 [Prolixibacteraceae bacterium Z1-6]|uniref:Uncharacterized protein n=1 Tax=Draconibacterium aestuarii TaxID=2998507 RepID=A0A9X3FAP1_9BACT|nr:hypothetical protein [Prolixibacteraceae bacterium Z1-6]
MNRRKKKNTSQQQKQEFRHRRNEFFKKIKQVASLLGDASVIDLLGERERKLMYICRLRPHNLINSTQDETKTTANNLRVLNQYFSHFLHHSYVDIEYANARLTYSDFSVYAITLYIFWVDVHKNFPKIADRFKNCFPVFNHGFDDHYAVVEDKIDKFLQVLGWMFSDFKKSVVRFDRDQPQKHEADYQKRSLYNNWIIENKRGENELLEINGHKRANYRLYFNSGKAFEPLCVTPQQLGLTGIMQDFRLQVFIQQHAINRIKERISEQYELICYLDVVYAILTNAIPLNNNKSFLFPLSHGKVKLGYLKADIIGDKLVIRTFLFLTNNGTPEGKILHDLLGVVKADKAYLGIDKLSTFINSDIKNDARLKELFSKAHCADLFTLDRYLLDDPKSNEIACARFITNYLGTQMPVYGNEG